MCQYNNEILLQLKAVSHPKKTTLLSDNYSGSSHYRYNVTTANSRKIAKEWANLHKDISHSELIDTLSSLSNGESIEEKMMVGKIIEYLPKRRREIEPLLLDLWLDNFVGWAEIDSLCQSNFTEKDLLGNWEAWEKVIKRFAVNKNISKRRASLVLLTGPVSHSGDKRLVRAAFDNIDRLKSEKDILVTKAISWLLRSLLKLHKAEVERYLEKNADLLPPIAVRETRNKLKIGRKYKRNEAIIS